MVLLATFTTGLVGLCRQSKQGVASLYFDVQFWLKHRVPTSCFNRLAKVSPVVKGASKSVKCRHLAGSEYNHPLEDQIIKLQKKEKKQMQNKVAQAQKMKGGQQKRANTTVKGNHQLYVLQHLQLPYGPKFLYTKQYIDSLSSSLIYHAFLQQITANLIEVRPNTFAVKQFVDTNYF